MHRRVEMDERGVKVRLERAPPVVKPSGAEEDRREKRREKRRRRKRRRVKDQRGEVTLLMGDSLVGGATSKCFTSLESTNRCVAYPGAGVWKVTREVRNLRLQPGYTLILSAGGNDFFGRNGRTGEVDAFLRDYKTMLVAAKEKSNRSVVVGLVPRMYRRKAEYEKAKSTNRKIEKLCKGYGMQFVDPWPMFFGVDKFFQKKDGVHFTEQGSRAFVQLLKQSIRAPHKVVERRPDGKGDVGRKRRVRRKRGPPKEPERVERQVANTSITSVMMEEAAPPSTRPPKRMRSPGTDGSFISPVVARSQKRRRASEGELPGPGSPPVRAGQAEGQDQASDVSLDGEGQVDQITEYGSASEGEEEPDEVVPTPQGNEPPPE